MRIRHPYSLSDDSPTPDDVVHYGGRRRVAEVDEDDTFEVPDDRARAFLSSWPTAEGYDASALIVSDGADSSVGDSSTGATDAPDEDETPTCAGTTADGSPCTREVDAPGDYCFQHED